MNETLKHELIYRGQDVLDKFNFPILIAGCGALGSNLADNLSRMGFSNLTLLDMDRVEEQNISTQVWTTEDVGKMKTACLAEKIFLTSGAEAPIISKELSSLNSKKLLRNQALLVDCFDNAAARQALTDYARGNNVPCLHGGLFEDYGEIHWDKGYKVPSDIDEGDVCDYPLARNIIMLAVTVMSEEIVRFVVGDSKRNLAITLKDLRISLI